MSLNCVVCSSHFAELDVPIKCDSCSDHLKYFCSTCEQGLKELPELKLLIKKLLVEVEGLKNCLLQRPNNEVCNEFIINEINERNRRASNLICYIVIESDSNQSDVRIAYNHDQVNNILATITDSTNSVPLPIKVIQAFNIMKNKIKLLSRYPTISLSSDRTQYQRDHMKKLREELASFLTLDCDLLFLSEIWLNINYSDEELGFVNYNIFRADRESNHEVRGSGVLLAINTKYNCIRIPTESIVGNFNIPGFMWSINEPSLNNIVNLVANSFINYLDLKQCNNVANHRQDILDLIFSDSQINNIRKSLSLTPICDAYHPPLELIYPLITSPVTLVESLTPIIYNFNLCNFDEMCSFLSEFDFIYNFKNLSLAAATSKFYEIIRHTFDVYVTKFKFDPNNNQNITWKDPVL
ncbi:hypothetical protein QTP88_008147 [Uroleucon formosanum]